MDIVKELFGLSDAGYRDFHARLVPNLSKECLIGVRTPALKNFAKNMPQSDAEAFLKKLPHKYYEENNLHAFLICNIKDFDRAVFEVERFLPYIDNWATCDSLRPRVFYKNAEKLLPYISKWIKSEHTYTVRFAIECLMCYFLDERFQERYLEKVANVKSDDYYVNMMIAWYFSFALVKQWDSALPYLEQNRLSPWVHNKTISKAHDSFRVSADKKEYLKTLRRKD